MVQFMFEYSIDDIVIVYNYYDEMSVGIIKKIIIDENGIRYGVKIGFADIMDNFIYTNTKDGGDYRIAKCVGHYTDVDDEN